MPTVPTTCGRTCGLIGLPTQRAFPQRRLWRNRDRLPVLAFRGKTISAQQNFNGLHVRDSKRTPLRDAQKGQTSHPPNPGAPSCGLVPSKAATSDQRWLSMLAHLRCPLMARMSPPLRASNEGLLRPRVARAQGTHRATPPPAGGLFQHPANRSGQPGPLREGRSLPDPLSLCIHDIPDEGVLDQKEASG